MERASFGAVWCESTPPDIVRAALPTLARWDVRLHLGWPVGRDRFPLVSAAQAAGVVVHPWLLMPHGLGYWATVENADRFVRRALALMTRWTDAGFEPTTFVVDMEPEFARVMAAEGALARRVPDLRQLWRALRSGPNARCVQAAARTYTRFVAQAHRLGWQVHLTTLPFALDGGPHVEALRTALALPIGSADWDHVSVQAYRTIFDQYAMRALGRRGADVFGPHLVQAYGEATRAEFGDRAGLDLGLVGAGVFPSAIYDGPADLGADLGAAVAAGISTDACTVFDLKSILTRGAADMWFAAPVGGVPDPDRGTRWMRRGLTFFARTRA